LVQTQMERLVQVSPALWRQRTGFLVFMSPP
jgi:hypothetical protein